MMTWLKHKLQQLLIHKNDNVFVQFFRSIFAGGLATLVDWAIYYLLAILLHMNIFLATSISFTFGLIVNYYITQIWVFSYKPDNLTRSFATFTIIGLVGLGLNYLLFWIDDTYHLLENIFKLDNQDYINMLKKVIATFIVYIWNFSARKYFIFRESKKPNLKTESEVNP